MDQTNVIRLNSGSVYTYLKTDKKVIDYTLTFYHKGAECTVSLEDIENPQSVQTYTIESSYEYTEHTITYNTALNQEKLAFTSQGVSYIKNISVSRDLPNDSQVFCYRNYQPGEMLAPNTSSITFSTLLSAICELQCVCPNMNRLGQLEFVSPISGINVKDFTNDYAKNDTTFEDYTMLKPTGFDVYANSNTHLLKFPDQDDNLNPYIISGNIFLVTVTEDQARLLLNEMRPKILDISYTPANISMIVSDLTSALGDTVQITTFPNETSLHNYHCIMSQTLSGPQLVDQSIECRASGPNQSATVPNKNDSVVQGLTAKEYNTKVDDLETKVSTLVTKDSVELAISSMKKYVDESGADKVITKDKQYVFDDSGLKISESNAETSTLVDNRGMKVYKGPVPETSDDSSVMLSATDQGVNATNLHAITYLIIGKKSRFETYQEDRIGCFMI